MGFTWVYRRQATAVEMHDLCAAWWSLGLDELSRVLVHWMGHGDQVGVVTPHAHISPVHIATKEEKMSWFPSQQLDLLII